METEVRNGIEVPVRKWYNAFLNMEDVRMRILRRALIIGVLTAVSLGLTEYAQIAPEYLVPIIAGCLAALEKALREYKQ